MVPNSATTPGNQQGIVPPDPDEICGKGGSYGELKKTLRVQDPVTKKNTHERDHIPSKRALLEFAVKKERRMSKSQRDCVAYQVEQKGRAIAIKYEHHRNYSPTCGDRELYKTDSDSAEKMKAARERDLKAMQDHLNGDPPDKPADPCAGAYAEAAKELLEFDFEEMVDDAIDHCKSKYPR